MATTTIDNLTIKSPLRATVPVDNSTHEDRDYDLYGELAMEGSRVTELNNGHISKAGGESGYQVQGTFSRNVNGSLWINLDGPASEHADATAAITSFIDAAYAKAADMTTLPVAG